MSPARARIKILPLAALEIDDQADYYEREANETLTLRWVRAASDAIRSLQSFPERGTRVDMQYGNANSIRRAPIAGFPNHLIFYRYDSTQHTVFVVRVLHGARDFASIL